MIFMIWALVQKKRSKGPRKPEYTGPPPPPNRFGIKPGYRWDGVGTYYILARWSTPRYIEFMYTISDRGNGFEKKMFQRVNDRKRRTAESYEWSVDDM